MSNATRVQAYKARKRATSDLVQVNVLVPRWAVQSLKAAAESLRNDPGLRIAQLVDVTTGRLYGLDGRR